MQVLKFGGTSVSSPARIIEIVKESLKKDRTVLVCSAMSGCTDAFIRMGHLAARKDEAYLDLLEEWRRAHVTLLESLLAEDRREGVRGEVNALFSSLADTLKGVYLLGELSPGSLEAIQSYGELLSTKILATKFGTLGISCRWLDARKLIKGNSRQTDFASTYANIAEAVDAYPHTRLFVLPGFIASDAEGRTTTLGRGGSDYTAALAAVAVKARLVEIWTDVRGIMTADPRIVPAAVPIRNISYRAAQELSHFGAKVIFPPTIQPVVAEGIPIYVKDTFHPEDPGTLVEQNPPHHDNTPLGISHSDKIALLSLEGSGMVGVPGFSSRLFDALSRKGVNIILITQASSLHTMCIAVSEADASSAKQAADDCFAYEISLGRLNPLKVETGYSIICLVGDDILGNCGGAGRMLASLGSSGIPVRATAQGSSERNISVIVRSHLADDAIRAIHKSFFEKSQWHEIPVFVAGCGHIGHTLLKMIEENTSVIADAKGKRLRLCGVANSRRYLLDLSGVESEKLSEGTEGNFIDALLERTVENAVFVDCTASLETGPRYKELLEAGYNIVSCNKIPFSGTLESYQEQQNASARSGRFLRFETTAGAALPLLQAAERIRMTGDKLVKLEAVLSGTLNYLCDQFHGSGFDEILRDAQEKGYTEPDPAIDLSGMDVKRKVIILARKAGIALEEDQVEVTPFPVGDALVKAYNEAGDKKLKYLATLFLGDDGSWKATARLETVGLESPLSLLRGTDNCAIFTSRDYPQGLVIQGAGAGQRQTAGGLLLDIIS